MGGKMITEQEKDPKPKTKDKHPLFIHSYLRPVKGHVFVVCSLFFLLLEKIACTLHDIAFEYLKSNL